MTIYQITISLSGTNRPDVAVDVGLTGAAHAAIPHTDDPRAVRVVGAGRRRRPVVDRLHIIKALRIKPCSCIRLSGMYQASKLIDIGQMPIRITEVVICI